MARFWDYLEHPEHIHEGLYEELASAGKSPATRLDFHTSP